MKYFQKLIDNELKDMSAEERDTYRRTSLITFQMLAEELKDRKKEFEQRIFDSVRVVMAHLSIDPAGGKRIACARCRHHRYVVAP